MGKKIDFCLFVLDCWLSLLFGFLYVKDTDFFSFFMSLLFLCIGLINYLPYIKDEDKEVEDG